ncbi:MAG: UDP-N-acetylmuramate--L-alanine ligase [Oscillospiraceae bacterium]|nr:UDP-N-acetylmuramate--L-alanine ligase [Oscillospiraceae bacterium]
MENLLNFNSNSSIMQKRIHLIGIGGSGMYPLAQILHGKGVRLTGSDNNPTDTVEAVRKMGIKVFMSHSPDNVTGADLVVRSAAIKDDNPEIVAARDQGITVIERADLLGAITRHYDKAICVSGTHGKTTVSSMLTYIFMSQNDRTSADISAVIGGKLKILDGGSGRMGASDVMICEACEYADTFLKLEPNISLILNINCDHLEYFKTMENLRLSFTKFCNLTKDVLVVNGDDENTVLAVNDSDFSGRIITFGRKESNDYFPKNINGREFDLFGGGDFVASIKLNIPGEHNILNATAACATATAAGVDTKSLVKGLESFTGAGRRFETLGCINGVTVVDDYAHHPAEITATLNAAKSMGWSRIWAVHQPFTYSRTKSMLDEFAKSLSIADKVTLTEIMGGREIDNGDIFAEDLAKITKNCNWFGDFCDVCDYVVENSRPGDLIITLGCGDVNKISQMIVKNLKNF